MTKLKKESDATDSTTKSTSPTAARRSPVKRNVRQKLPSMMGQSDDDDDDDDDDTDLMRNGAAGLTVADALKQRQREKPTSGGGSAKSQNANDRAKKWGIDMTKFK
jgi:hypothetical protein